MTGKTVVITGASSGIGKRTALHLAQLGATVILACRDVAKGRAVASEIGDRVPGAPRVRVVALDLCSAVSVAACASALPRPDVLVLNAGLNANVPTRLHPCWRSCSTVFGVNFVAHWLLVRLLDVSDKMPKRLVCVSSVMHHLADPDALRCSQSSSTAADYAESKLAMLLLARHVSRERGLDAVAVNPGAVDSDIWRHVWSPVAPLLRLVASLFFLTPDQGAATSVYAAASADDESGSYLAPYWHPPPGCFPGRSAFEWLGPFHGGRNYAYCRVPPDEAAVTADLFAWCHALCSDFLPSPTPLGASSPKAPGNADDRDPRDALLQHESGSPECDDSNDRASLLREAHR